MNRNTKINLKIALLLPDLNGGGAERVASILLSQWQKMGFSAYCLSTNKPNEPAYKEFNFIPVFYFLGTPIAKVLKIHNFLKNEKIDFIIAFSESSCFLSLLAVANTRAKLICSERNSPKDYPKRRMLRFLRTFSYKMADAIVFQSEGAKNYFSKSIQRKGTVIPNPASAFGPIEKNKIAIKEDYIVCIGRLDDQKRPNLAIKAFSVFHQHYSTAKLIFVGNGRLENDLVSMASKMGLSANIVFEHFSRSPESWLKNSKLFLMTSEFEGFPNVLLEAAVCKKPIVTTDFRPGVASQIVKNGKNGYIIPLSENEQTMVQDLAQKMCLIFENYTHFSQEATIASKPIQVAFNQTTISKRWLSLMVGMKRK